jgi:hypothetical protein
LGVGRSMLFLPRTKSPRPTLRSSRDKSGDGSSPRSLSRAGVRRLIGRRLPDAILHGKRSLRPRSRAVQRFTTAGFRVRLFSSLGLVVAPPACEPGQDTSANSFPRLHHLAPGRLPILSERSPGATGLASLLSGCFSFSGQRCVFYIAGVSEGFHGSCRDPVSFPVRTLTLSRLSASFVWLTPSREPPESPVRADAQ